MTLSLSELDAVVAELAPLLSGAKVRGVFQPDGTTVLLTVAQGKAQRRILLCTAPGASRIHLTTRSFPAGRTGDPPAFAFRLRPEIHDAVVEGIETRYDDRVVVIRLRKGASEDVEAVADAGAVVGATGVVRRPGRKVVPAPVRRRTLLFECSGRHPNVFLLDEEDRILALLGPSRSHQRDLRPGRRYARPLRHDAEAVETLRFVGPEVSRDIEKVYAEAEGREAAAAETADVKLGLEAMIAAEERNLKEWEWALRRPPDRGRSIDRADVERRLGFAQARLDKIRDLLLGVMEGREGAMEKARMAVPRKG